VQLEKDKAAIQLDAANDRYACETFALGIFKRADRVDRAGRADANTCKAYYAASIFIEVGAGRSSG
jgi:vacuolar protein sorting-associated protein VTA1